MKNNYLIILLLVFSASIIGCQKNTNNKDLAEAKTNSNSETMNKENTNKDAAPDFALQSTDGKTIKLSDYKGKIVIIDFWATWCPPCRKGIPDLIEIQKEFKDKVVVIGVSLDIQSKKDVMPFMKQYGMNYPVVYGNQKVVVDYGNINAIPTSFIINKKGEVAAKHIGLVPKSTYVKKIKELTS